MEAQDDFYITLLKYGRNELRDKGQINFDEALKHVASKHPKVHEEAIRDACNVSLRGLPMSGAWTLHNEAYFQLLEHEELQQARNASQDAHEASTKALGQAKWAFRAAIAAMGITVAVAVASFIVPKFYTPTVEIEAAQFELLIEAHDNAP